MCRLVLMVFSMMLISSAMPWAMNAAAMPKGTGAGNGFKHLVNEPFDFHIAYPPTWDLEVIGVSGTAVRHVGAASGEVLGWRLRNAGIVADPLRQSRVDVDFMAGHQAGEIEELLDYAQQQYPQYQWQEIHEDQIAGITTGDIVLSPDRTLTIDYYLSDRHMVIRLERLADKEQGGVRDVNLIVASIDRASAGPRITAIAVEGGTQYQVDATACYLVYVDDLKGSFNNRSLRGFRVQGHYPHWVSFKSSWVPEMGAFRICQHVLGNFTGGDLRITYLQLESLRGITLQCDGSLAQMSAPPFLDCSNERRSYRVDLPAVLVDNPNPQLDPPRMTSLVLDQNARQILVSINAASPIAVGSIKTDREVSTIIYPDEVSGGALTLDVDRFPRIGWLTLVELVFYDLNGHALRLTAAPCEPGGGEHADTTRYSEWTTEGVCQQTELEVISFFNGG